MSASRTSLNLSIQRGSCYELSSQILMDFFQVFGKIEELKYHEEKGKGVVKFESEEVARSLLFKNLVIGECTIFTWRSLDSLGEKPEPGLLLVGRNLFIILSVDPESWLQNLLGYHQGLRSCLS